MPITQSGNTLQINKNSSAAVDFIQHIWPSVGNSQVIKPQFAFSYQWKGVCVCVWENIKITE